MKRKEKLIKKVENTLAQIIDSGVPEQKIVSQLNLFEQGFSSIKLNRACIPFDGIKLIPESDLEHLQQVYSTAVKEGRAMKFVPASGAATRMFKSLLALSSKYDQIDLKILTQGDTKEDMNHQVVLKFIQSIKKFAFYEDLKSVLAKQGGDIDGLIENSHYKEVIDGVLNDKGLNYGLFPKGLIKFHTYKDHARTAFEEQLAEAVYYTADKNGIARIHFTVPPQHQPFIEAYFISVRNRYETNGIKLEISLSIQKSETNTIAVDLKNRAFRTDGDQLLFRPSGHGALIENLNDLNGDIVFIKNIDNVVPDHLKPETYLYKKVLGGYLVELQNRTFYYLNMLDAKKAEDKDLDEMAEFVRGKLLTFIPRDFKHFPREKQVDFLFNKFNRPIRVCGMVKNQCELGGGPFWAEHEDQSQSIQIVEKSQINLQLPDQEAVFKDSTHFNPVDIVCGVRNYKGEPFDLIDFVDFNTGFITVKSKEGKELKAIELPGFWNGSMAYWNSIFVEVPLITFNPVKTVNDLLKKEHQP